MAPPGRQAALDWESYRKVLTRRYQSGKTANEIVTWLKTQGEDVSAGALRSRFFKWGLKKGDFSQSNESTESLNQGSSKAKPKAVQTRDNETQTDVSIPPYWDYVAGKSPESLQTPQGLQSCGIATQTEPWELEAFWDTPQSEDKSKLQQGSHEANSAEWQGNSFSTPVWGGGYGGHMAGLFENNFSAGPIWDVNGEELVAGLPNIFDDSQAFRNESYAANRAGTPNKFEYPETLLDETYETHFHS